MNDATNRSAKALFLATENLRGITLMVVARLVFAGSDTFTKLASKGPDNALLREVADDLDTAGAEIQEAREKVTAVADGKLAKLCCGACITVARRFLPRTAPLITH